MKFSTFLSLILAVSLLLCGNSLWAQETDEEPVPPPAVEPVDAPADTSATGVEEEQLEYEDYNVKAYSLTLYGGQFSGARYLENKPLGPRTVITEGADFILGYDGNILAKDPELFSGAHKEIEPGPAFGGRIGIYISTNFHLDILGTYATGEAVTTMLETDVPRDFTNAERVEVDRDPNYKMLKGGLALMYDAESASIFGIVPRLGFGLGGIINRYSQLADVTGLYLEGNFGLNYELFDNFLVGGQVDVTSFAYDVEELGYSNMVNYTTFSFGITWHLDVVPDDVRAAHFARQEK